MNGDSATSTFWDFARERLTSFSSACAVSAEEGNLSFSELLSGAEEIAASLSRTGLREGDTVLLAIPNTNAFVPAFLALAKLSVTVGLVPPKYSSTEMQAIIDNIRPRAILTTTTLAAAHGRTLGLMNWQAVASRTFTEDLRYLKFETSATGTGHGYVAIKFTSGSSGTPKAIPLTAGNILAECQTIASTLSLTPRDRILIPVPLAHSYGFDLGVLSMLYAGATIVPREGFVPRKMLQEITAREVTIFLGVPSMYRLILETAGRSVADLSHLRYLLSCTAPLHAETIDAFYEKFSVPICQHYGSSETGALTMHVPAQVQRKRESVGIAMGGVELRILDDLGNEQRSGVEGEVVVASAAAAKTYLMGMPAKSPFRGGKYWTGDFGVKDEDGFLIIRGRIDGLINVGGFKVSPLEVVQVLESHGGVREAAVTGATNPAGEEFVYAAVTVRNSASEGELIAYCRSRLAEYKIPRRIEIRETLPRGPSGKIILRKEDIRL